MEINKTPHRTSKNYGINHFDFDENNILVCGKKFEAFFVDNLKNCEVIDDEFDTNLLVNQKPNFCVCANITKSQTEPIIFNFVFDQNNSALAGALKICIEPNVDAKVIIRFVSKQKVYKNFHIIFQLKEGASAFALVYTNLHNDSTNLQKMSNFLQKNAKFDYKIVDFCSQNSIQNFSSDIYDDAVCDLKSLYFGDNNNEIDLNYIQNVYGKNACANIECVGALLKNASKNFKGTIDFKHGSKKSKGTENELCLMLSKNAKSKALPMLLCAEEDIDGSHSSSVGQIDKKKLFYMQSRGIDKTEALKIFVKAKFNSVLNDLDAELRNEILYCIDRKLEDDNKL